MHTLTHKQAVTFFYSDRTQLSFILSKYVLVVCFNLHFFLWNREIVLRTELEQLDSRLCVTPGTFQWFARSQIKATTMTKLKRKKQNSKQESIQQKAYAYLTTKTLFKE